MDKFKSLNEFKKKMNDKVDAAKVKMDAAKKELNEKYEAHKKEKEEKARSGVGVD